LSQALESVARTKKYGDETTAPITVRVPMSVRDYLAESGDSAGLYAYEVILFEKELTEHTKDILQDLRISAALKGQNYDADRAETISRLLRLGLKAEKLTRK
jgi:hypothetical protein